MGLNSGECTGEQGRCKFTAENSVGKYSAFRAAVIATAITGTAIIT